MAPARARFLARVSRDDWSNEGFPFGAIRTVGVGTATCLASRRNYMGELGFELYVPTEMATAVYDTLKSAGETLRHRRRRLLRHRIAAAGEGLPGLGRELTPDDNPYQAGLGFAVKPGKSAAFLGQEALIAARSAPLTRRIVSIRGVMPDSPVAWGGELLLREGQPVGEVTSAAWGHTLNGITALGWLRLPRARRGMRFSRRAAMRSTSLARRCPSK